jgi:alkylation response protein AidB-like acyl-CoA dehydrogenase
MDFGLTDEQQLLLESLQEWLDRNITEEDMQKWYYENHGVPVEISKSYYDAGFAMLGVPEEYGGTPCDFVTIGLVMEATARHVCANLMFADNLGLFDLFEFGTPEQIQWGLDSMKQTGRLPFGMALSEPDAGSDSANIKTYVREENGKLIMKGQKTWVSSGENKSLKSYMVTAKDNNPDSQEVSIWFVDADAPGVSTAPLTEIGYNLMPFCEVYFDDVEIDPKNLLGVRGRGFYQLMRNFEMERAIISAPMVGMAQAAQDDAAAYASERITMGKPLASRQIIQEYLTDNEIDILNARNMLYYTLWKIDNKMDTRIETSLLKRFASKAGTDVADRCMQIFGGLGYTRETRVSRAWLDNRAYQIGGGTREIMVHIAGRLLAKKYAK